MEPLLKAGAKAAANPKEVAQKADIIFEVTANDESSKDVWLGEEGILKGAQPGSCLISCATISVEWVDELAETCTEEGFTFFDMPMTGGRMGAEMGKLIFLVGGDEKKLEMLKPDLTAVSEQVLYFGKAGSGMRYKLLLNMLQAIHIVDLGEVLKIAEKSGMDMKRVGDALAERPGGTTTKLTWRDYQKKPDPINFSVQWIRKDLGYAKKFADTLKLPLLDDVIKLYDEAIKHGLSEGDWTEVTKI